MTILARPCNAIGTEFDIIKKTGEIIGFVKLYGGYPYVWDCVHEVGRFCTNPGEWYKPDGLAPPEAKALAIKSWKRHRVKV